MMNSRYLAVGICLVTAALAWAQVARAESSTQQLLQEITQKNRDAVLLESEAQVFNDEAARIELEAKKARSEAQALSDRAYKLREVVLDPRGFSTILKEAKFPETCQVTQEMLWDGKWRVTVESPFWKVRKSFVDVGLMRGRYTKSVDSSGPEAGRDYIDFGTMREGLKFSLYLDGTVRSMTVSSREGMVSCEKPFYCPSCE